MPEEHVNKEVCEERHKRIDLEMKDVKDKLKSIDKKVWVIVMTLLVEVVGVLGIFIKGCAT